jgi:hypothetical protein
VSTNCGGWPQTESGAAATVISMSGKSAKLVEDMEPARERRVHARPNAAGGKIMIERLRQFEGADQVALFDQPKEPLLGRLLTALRRIVFL